MTSLLSSFVFLFIYASNIKNELGNRLDDERLEPLYQKAADKNLLIFLHPHYGIPNELYGEKQNGHVLPLAMGFPFETTIVWISPLWSPISLYIPQFFPFPLSSEPA
jgi:hypothetical protein